MGEGAVRIAGVGLAALAVAAGAVWALSPSDDAPDPVDVSEKSYFSAEESERAADFRGGQRALGLASLVVEFGLLAALALWRPPPLRRALDAAGRRPLLGGAAVAAGISLTLTIAGLPLSAWAHERAVDIGLATQSFGSWLTDVARSAGISAVFAAVGGLIAMALIRRLRERWWVAGAAVVVAFAIVLSWLAPVVLAPLFNDFDELPQGKIRSEVIALGEEAGVDIGDVYEVDASRRSTGLNAYVGGLGSTKRVVLYDNLIREEDPATIRSVVAHELGHVDGDDIWRGIAFVAIVAPLGVLWIQFATGGITRRTGDDPRSPAVLPALALTIAIASFALGVAGQALSRNIERRADTFALELTKEPEAFIELQRRLALTNISDPDPPGFYQAVFGSHPTTVERIGAAIAFREAEDD